MQGALDRKPEKFLSTPSARRATITRLLQILDRLYFYPRPPRGGRLFCVGSTMPPYLFLSTPSARRATLVASGVNFAMMYFYPRPPRGGRPSPGAARRMWRADFYPRPPRGGRRLFQCGLASGVLISIHALREEGDVRGQCIIHGTGGLISIHALREEGDIQRSCGNMDIYISIHALREEGDVV